MLLLAGQLQSVLTLFSVCEGVVKFELREGGEKTNTLLHRQVSKRSEMEREMPYL